jgi:hypothetical protein
MTGSSNNHCANVGSATDADTPRAAKVQSTATRVFDAEFVAPTNQYVKQWPLGQTKHALWLR